MICFQVLVIVVVADVALKSGVDVGDKSNATNLPPGVETFNCHTAASAKL